MWELIVLYGKDTKLDSRVACLATVGKKNHACDSYKTKEKPDLS